MDLFDHRERQLTEAQAPLAARMRPRTLQEYVGQEHIMAPGRLLRRAIEADQLSSVIFYGPPGTGKTTLAEVIAQRTQAHFHKLNAVLAGVKDLRLAIKEARHRRGELAQQTVLFVDEVHRFNKAQQDALLPWVEKGTVIFIGATTENPYFEVNKALVSRSRIFQLKPLTDDDLKRVLQRALDTPGRGFGELDVMVTDDACAHLVNVANGDARSLLNALELAVQTTRPDPQGRIIVTLSVAEESIQRRAVLYDKEGDAHFDIISAFIKSMRGSDPDASLYWLARMVYAGEDPRFILRRLLIFASEDVGLAAPEAVSVVNGCAQAYDRVGMPEGRYPLAQATLYLATAPKSNSVMGFFDALASVKNEREADVPVHLKDASRDKEGFGHGEGYLYPHAYRDHWVAQQYLPGSLQGRLYYQPSRQGYEASIFEDVARKRDAQIAAMLEQDALGDAPAEILTTSPEDPALERWLQRTLGSVGDLLGEQRDRLIDAAQLTRHHLCLDLQAASGLITWELVRACPEGGIWSRCATTEQADSLRMRAPNVDPLRLPAVQACSLQELGAILQNEDPQLRFDRILGRHALMNQPGHDALAQSLAALLRPDGRIVLLEAVPRSAQRIYALLPQGAVDATLLEAWREAEEAIYQDSSQPMLAWSPESLQRDFEAAGLVVEMAQWTSRTQRRLPKAQIDRWMDGEYGAKLAQNLEEEQLTQVRELLHRSLADELVDWSTLQLLLDARLAP